MVDKIKNIGLKEFYWVKKYIRRMRANTLNILWDFHKY